MGLDHLGLEPDYKQQAIATGNFNWERKRITGEFANRKIEHYLPIPVPLQSDMFHYETIAHRFILNQVQRCSSYLANKFLSDDIDEETRINHLMKDILASKIRLTSPFLEENRNGGVAMICKTSDQDVVDLLKVAEDRLLTNEAIKSAEGEAIVLMPIPISDLFGDRGVLRDYLLSKGLNRQDMEIKIGHHLALLKSKREWLESIEDKYTTTEMCVVCKVKDYPQERTYEIDLAGGKRQLCESSLSASLRELQEETLIDTSDFNPLQGRRFEVIGKSFQIYTVPIGGILNQN